MRTFTVVALLISFIASPVFLSAQIVGTDAFLQGNFVQIGISQCGVYASTNPPGTLVGPIGPYYLTETNGLGFVADSDMDGWTGPSFPEFCGDYFVPGSPVEGWAVQVDSGVMTNTDKNCFTDEFFGSITSYTDLGLFRKSTWQGADVLPSGDSITVFQETTLPVNELYFLSEVTICNLSSDTIFDLYYLRNVDPDNEQPWSGNYTTINEIELQFPMDTAAVVSATGLDYGCYFAYVTADPRARVSRGSFATGDPFNAWNAVFPHFLSGIDTIDEAVQVSFKIDEIAPGGCATMMFAHAFDADAVGAAIAATAGSGIDIIADGSYFNSNAAVSICEGEMIDITLPDVDMTGITWSPAAGLSTDTGSMVSATPMASTIYTFSGVSTTTGASISGTVSIEVIPPPLIDAGADMTINIALGDSATLTGSGGLSYFWSPAPLGAETDSSITVSPSMTTTYILSGVDANGCANTDSVTVFVVNEPANGLGSNLVQSVLVYPNPVPSGGTVQISHPDLTAEADVLLYDAVGRLAYSASHSVIAGQLHLELPDLTNGIYQLLLIDADGTYYGSSLMFD